MTISGNTKHTIVEVKPRGECMSMQLTIFEHSKTEKRCSKCKEVQSLDNFCKSKRAKDKLQTCCRQCAKFYRENNKEVICQKAKVYREKNKEYYAEYKKVYYKENKEKVRQYQKLYNEINKKNVNKKTVAYQRHRRKSDPLFRLIQNLRRRVCHFCKSVNMQKNWKTSYAMGCTREEFMAYFEPLFIEGMTWENYGAWHVDHIKPISLATTEQEAIQLSHYTNLQPLWAEDNRRKSNNY